jgi:hypothetical protein
MSRRGRGLATALVLGLAAGGLGLACSGSAPEPAHPRVVVGLRLPALDGGEVDLSTHRGKLVVLHLFTTWSVASQVDVDQLVAAYRHHPDRVEVIGIGLDPDGHVLVAPWRDANHIPYLVTLAPPALQRGESPLGRIVEVPTTVILNRDGSIYRRIDGPLGRGDLERLLTAALGS